MGNKLSLNRRRTSSTKDENIMFDIHNPLYDVANQISNTTSSTRSKSPSDIISSRHGTCDSEQLSYDMDNMNTQKPYITLPIKKPSPTTVNATISEKLLAAELAQQYTLNMLLSGTENSGKYIIFKQLEQAFRGSIDDQQTKLALDAIRVMIVRDMVTVCNINLQLQKQFETIYKIKNNELLQICIRVSKLKVISYNLSRQLAMTLYLLWIDKAIQNTYEKAIELHMLNESTKYFMNKVLEVVDKKYVLTFDDYIEIRAAQKKGVSEKQFLIECKYGKYRFNVNQINKQKGERKRWAPYLDNIQIFVFVVNIGKYDEDNNISNAIEIFAKICKDRTFACCDFVVLLNGINEFGKKIRSIPFTSFDVDEPNDKKCVQECIVNKFKEIYKMNNDRNEEIYMKRRNIYFHTINDSDTQQIGLLLQKIHTDVITTSMKRMGYVF